MELGELHVHEIGARLVGHGVAVTGLFPRVGGDPPSPASTAGRQDDGPGPEQDEAARFAPVAQDSGEATSIQEELQGRAFHVDAEPLVDRVVLQCADDLEAGPVADVRQAWIAVPAEIPLADQAVSRAIEYRSPFFQLAYALGGFPRMQLGHAPLVEKLAAPHRVAEVPLPVVAPVHIAE